MAKLGCFLSCKFDDFALNHFFVVSLLFRLDHGLVAGYLHGTNKHVTFVFDGGRGFDFLVLIVKFQQAVQQAHHGEFTVVINGRHMAFKAEGANGEVHVFVFDAVFSLATHGHVFKSSCARFALGVDTNVKSADFCVLD